MNPIPNLMKHLEDLKPGKKLLQNLSDGELEVLSAALNINVDLRTKPTRKLMLVGIFTQLAQMVSETGQWPFSFVGVVVDLSKAGLEVCNSEQHQHSSAPNGNHSHTKHHELLPSLLHTGTGKTSLNQPHSATYSSADDDAEMLAAMPKAESTPPPKTSKATIAAGGTPKAQKTSKAPTKNAATAAKAKKHNSEHRRSSILLPLITKHHHQATSGGRPAKRAPKCFFNRPENLQKYNQKESPMHYLEQYIKKESMTVAVASHSLSSKEFAFLLIDAAERGVDVYVVLNDWSKSVHQENWSAAKVLVEKGIQVRCASKVSKKTSNKSAAAATAALVEQMKHRFIVFESQNLVWTGSFEFQENSPNWEDALVVPCDGVGGQSVFESYQNEFTHIWEKHSFELQL